MSFSDSFSSPPTDVKSSYIIPAAPPTATTTSTPIASNKSPRCGNLDRQNKEISAPPATREYRREDRRDTRDRNRTRDGMTRSPKRDLLEDDDDDDVDFQARHMVMPSFKALNAQPPTQSGFHTSLAAEMAPMKPERQISYGNPSGQQLIDSQRDRRSMCPMKPQRQQSTAAPPKRDLLEEEEDDDDIDFQAMHMVIPSCKTPNIHPPGQSGYVNNNAPSSLCPIKPQRQQSTDINNAPSLQNQLDNAKLPVILPSCRPLQKPVRQQSLAETCKNLQ